MAERPPVGSDVVNDAREFGWIQGRPRWETWPGLVGQILGECGGLLGSGQDPPVRARAEAGDADPKDGMAWERPM